MPIYVFKAHNARGRRISGEMKAVDEIELKLELKKLGLVPSSIKEKSDRDAFSIMDLFTSIQYGFESFFRLILGKSEEVSANTKASEFQRTRAHRKDIRDRIASGDTQKMQTFSYLATTRSGSRIYGEMEAADEADLTNRLLLLELTLVRANTFEAIEESGTGRGFKYKVPLKEQVILASQLENYFRLDMLMTEVLDAVRVGCESDKLKQLLIGIRNHVARGDSLLAAIRRYPANTFSRFFYEPDRGWRNDRPVFGRFHVWKPALAMARRHTQEND